MLLGGLIEGGSNPLRPPPPCISHLWSLSQVVVLSVLTDVGVLEQSADPGFSLQLLMVWRTVKLWFYHHTPTHTVKSKHSRPIHAERTMCSYLQVRKWCEASYSFFIYFFQVNKMSSGWFFSPQGYWQWAPRYKRLSFVHLWEEPEGCTRPRCPFSPSFQIDTTREEGMCGGNRTRVKERKRRVRRGNSGIGNNQVWGKERGSVEFKKGKLKGKTDNTNGNDGTERGNRRWIEGRQKEGKNKRSTQQDW